MGAVCGRPFYYPLLIQLAHSHSQSLPVLPSPSLSPSLQVSGANYAGTFEVTRARGTYPTSLSATLPPARYGTVRCSTAQVGRAQPSPAQPSFLVPVSPSLSCLCQGQSSLPARQAVSQSVAVLVAQSSIPSLSRIHLASPSSRRTSRTGLVPGKRVHAHCTLGLPHCARPSLPPCLHLPPKPAHTLLCLLHLAPCTLLPSHLLPSLCVLVVCVCVLLMCACACACVSMGGAVLN